MKVHEIMTAHARCAGPENTLVEAAGLMRQLDIGALPVCEEDRIVGMVTDRDITIRAVADGRDPNNTAVRDVMTAAVAHVMADQSVEEAARLMQQREIRRLPVLNRNRRLVGILSLGDIAMSSTPAFSGMTLREVSEPEVSNGRQRKRDALGRAAGASERMPGTAATTRESEAAARSPRQPRAKSPRTTRKRTSGGDRSRVSSQSHEVHYAGKKLGKRGAARIRKAKEALGRKTGRATVIRKARSRK